MQPVAAFTGAYLPTVNDVTYTIQMWCERWHRRGGRIDVMFPADDDHNPKPGEYGIRSLPSPFCERIRIGVSHIPGAVDDVDIVHVHTPFGLGSAGLRLARRYDILPVMTYYTPTGEYTEYLSSVGTIEYDVRRTAERYEWWFFDRADAVVVPNEDTECRLVDEAGVEAETVTLSNGIDTERSEPVEGDDFRRHYDLGNDSLTGYTGRHGYKKCSNELVWAAADLGATLVFGDDDLVRGELSVPADDFGVDARFLGSLDHEELPAFYSAPDVFCFPSPVETRELVAPKANACGTPIISVNGDALENTTLDGVADCHYESGDLDGFRRGIRRALAEHEELSVQYLDRHDGMSVDRSVDRLATLYDRLASK